MIYHSRLLLIFYILVARFSTHAQTTFLEVSSNWSDSFKEWTIYSVDSLDYEIETYMGLKNPDRANWSEWIAESDDTYTQIRKKWPNRDDVWECRGYTGLITAQAKWRNDPTIWVITTDDLTITWRTEYKNDLNYWYFEDEELGYFTLQTFYAGNPQNWAIDDKAPSLNDEVKQCMIFLALNVTSPRI